MEKQIKDIKVLPDAKIGYADRLTITEHKGKHYALLSRFNEGVVEIDAVFSLPDDYGKIAYDLWENQHKFSSAEATVFHTPPIEKEIRVQGFRISEAHLQKTRQANGG